MKINSNFMVQYSNYFGNDLLNVTHFNNVCKFILSQKCDESLKATILRQFVNNLITVGSVIEKFE